MLARAVIFILGIPFYVVAGAIWIVRELLRRP